MKDLYLIGVPITAVLTFISCWIYAVMTYGFFLGIGLGWLPAIVIAIIAGWLWPLIALVIVLTLVAVIALLYV
jgi:hypothetical protein